MNPAAWELIGNAGAYTTCYSGRSAFNGYPAPAVKITKPQRDQHRRDQPPPITKRGEAHGPLARFSAESALSQRRVSAESAAQATWRHNDPRRGAPHVLPDAYKRGLSKMMAVKNPRITVARGPRRWQRLWPLAALAAAGAALPMTAGVASAGVHDSTYRQVNLVSDIPVSPPRPTRTLSTPGVFPPLRAPTRHRAERCGCRTTGRTRPLFTRREPRRRSISPSWGLQRINTPR